MKNKFFALLAVVIVLIGSVQLTRACTNVLITKGASVDGSTLISYAADSHVLFGELYFWPRASWPAGAMMPIYEWDTGKFLGEIPQVANTYQVVGNMNEWQLSIGETTYGGRPELIDSKGLVDYGSLIYITLARAKNAREAIRIMAELVANYGYYSSGESFSIADPNEVWILEMIGKGEGNKGALWVAVRIPDGMVSGHANQARIQKFTYQKTNNWDDPKAEFFNAPDVIQFAKDKGLYTGADKDFSFSDTYAPVDFGAARFCDARVWSFFRKMNSSMDSYRDYAMGHDLKNRMPLYIKPDKKVSAQEVMDFMRDHYEGTPMDMTQDIGAGPYKCPYRWRPMTYKVDSATYFNERAIATQQTGFIFVAQQRSWLPREVGGILWFGVDDASTTVFNPIYCSSSRVPETYARGNGDMMTFKADAAFWVFNQVSNLAYTRYSDIYQDIRVVQSELEKKFHTRTPIIDQAAVSMLKIDPAMAIEYLTDYSVNTANGTTHRWMELYAFLFTKYMDGNIKTPNPGEQNPHVKQPGYGSDWYRTIKNATGDKLKYPGDAGH